MQWAIPIFIRCHPLLRNLAISRGGGIQSTGNSKEGMNDSWKFQGIRKMVPGNWYQGGTRCQSDVTSHFCDICRVSVGIPPPPPPVKCLKYGSLKRHILHLEGTLEQNIKVLNDSLFNSVSHNFACKYFTSVTCWVWCMLNLPLVRNSKSWGKCYLGNSREVDERQSEVPGRRTCEKGFLSKWVWRKIGIVQLYFAG